jgi:thiamine biosynthesis lipoprotein
MDRRSFLSLLPPALAALRLRSTGRAAGPSRLVERWSWAMGQPVHLRLFTDSEDRGYEAAQAAFAELRRVEGLLSRFDPTSELNELHRLAGRRSLVASADLLAVLGAAAAHRVASGGAFDVAVEPLMRVWGFREGRKALPGSRELAEAAAALAAAEVRIEGPRAFLPAAHTRLDLAGIGVGYGLDRAGALLRRLGIHQALLEISGDILALGAPPGRDGWPVDIVAPAQMPDSWHGDTARSPAPVLATVRLADQALATSGQSAERRTLGATSVGHVMDPAAIAPVRERWQATVVARSGVAADVLAKVLLVSGRRSPAMQATWLVPSAAG